MSPPTPLDACMRSSVTERHTRVQSLADGYLRQHGLSQIGWRFGMLDSVNHAGCCHYASRSIYLSVHLVEDVRHDMSVLDNVLLHEVAHALAGNEAGHGPHWREVALRIGNDGCVLCNITVRHPPHACRVCGAGYSCRHRLQQACFFICVCVFLVWTMSSLFGRAWTAMISKSSFGQ